MAFSQEIHIDNRSYLANASPVVDDGEIIGAVASLKDITKLRRFSDTKSAFLNMVSHEIRSPLGIIEGYLDLILKGIAKDEAQTKDIIRRARVRAQTLRQLVDDLLNLARMESEKVKRELVPVDLPKIILEVVEFYRDKAEEKNIKVNVSLEKVPAILMDRNDIILLFTNLLENAIKYNVKGGSINIYIKEEGPDLCLRVEDTGIGIPPESRERIFDEFYRVKNEKTRRIPGTGLGLSIVRRIVKTYQGKIKVDSRKKGGSIFSVYLPLRNFGVEV